MKSVNKQFILINFNNIIISYAHIPYRNSPLTKLMRYLLNFFIKLIITF